MLPSRHSNHWFEDGDVLLHYRSIDTKEEEVLYKVHTSKLSLSRLSPKTTDSSLNGRDLGLDLSNCHYTLVESSRVDARDLDILLDHLYGSSDLSTAYSYEKISSIMRASSPDQLDVPRLYQEATSYFKSLVPAQPEVIATFRCDWAEDAMALSIKFHITEVQKPLIYYLIAHSELDRFPSWVAPDMVERIKQQVETIMPRLIDQFSPVIFTPPPTSHMECTDIIADRWMTLVITPALRDGGTGKPLDFLETMKGLEWEREGVCKDCVADKRDEWMEEQRKIWELLDGWISETQK